MNEKKVSRLINIFEIIAFIIIVALVIVVKFYPELKQQIGSSDLTFGVGEYTSIVGIEVDDGLDFMLVINEDTVKSLLFFNEDSLTLYNKNIENNKIAKSLDIITEYIELYDNSKINVINYTQEGTSYDKIILYLRKKYGNIIIEKNGILTNKIQQLGLSVHNTEIDTLFSYSLDLTSKYKNSRLLKEQDLTELKAKKLANNVYLKLIDYASVVYNQELNSEKYPIQLIDADTEKYYHPNSDSWYYIQDGKVYAYISFSDSKNKYGFCFRGSTEISNEDSCYERDS